MWLGYSPSQVTDRRGGKRDALENRQAFFLVYPKPLELLAIRNDTGKITLALIAPGMIDPSLVSFTTDRYGNDSRNQDRVYIFSTGYHPYSVTTTQPRKPPCSINSCPRVHSVNGTVWVTRCCSRSARKYLSMSAIASRLACSGIA